MLLAQPYFNLASSCHRERKFALAGQGLQEFGQSLVFPQPPKDQRRSPLLGRPGCQPRGPDRLHHPEVVAEFAQGAEQTVQLPGGCQLIPAPQSRDYLLPDFPCFPVGPNDLQVLIGFAILPTTFGANEHDNNMPLNMDYCQVLSTLRPHYFGTTV